MMRIFFIIITMRTNSIAFIAWNIILLGWMGYILIECSSNIDVIIIG